MHRLLMKWFPVFQKTVNISVNTSIPNRTPSIILSIRRILTILLIVCGLLMGRVFLFFYTSIVSVFQATTFLLTIEKSPETTHTINATLTDPVLFKTSVGDTKIPEPMMDPMITVHPLRRLILAWRRISPSSSCSGSLRMFRTSSDSVARSSTGEEAGDS